MTVNELIEGLQSLVEMSESNGDRLVIVASNPEGNTFSPVAGDDGPDYTLGNYHLKGPHYREFFDDADDSEDIPEGGELCVALWPE